MTNLQTLRTAATTASTLLLLMMIVAACPSNFVQAQDLIVGCPTNTPAVPSDVVLSGRLIAGGFAATALGIPFPESVGTTPNSEQLTLNLFQNTPTSIGVTGLTNSQTLNGVLIKVVDEPTSGGGNGTLTMTPSNSMMMTATACAPPAIGLTTSDDSSKPSVVGTIQYSSSAGVPTMGLLMEITVAVVEGDGTVSYYFSKYTLNFMVSGGIQPTPGPPTPPVPMPTLSPTSPVPTNPPVPVPTNPPAPVPAPTNPPVPAPTNPPVPSPTNPPVPAPTNAPVPAPTNAPVPAPTNPPVPAPTNPPVPAPTNPPVPAPTNPPVPVPTNAPDEGTLIVGCPDGTAAIPPNVLLSGRLILGGFAVTGLGIPFPETPEGTPNSEQVTLNFFQNTPTPIGVTGLTGGQTLNGVLIKVVDEPTSGGGTGTLTMTPSNSLMTIATACTPPAIGLTTTDDSSKPSVVGTIEYSSSAGVPIMGLALEVTVAVVETDGTVSYYFSKYTLNFMVSGGIQPSGPPVPATPTNPPAQPPVDELTCLYGACVVGSDTQQCCFSAPVCRAVTPGSSEGQCRSAERISKNRLGSNGVSIFDGSFGRGNRGGRSLRGADD